MKSSDTGTHAVYLRLTQAKKQLTEVHISISINDNNRLFSVLKLSDVLTIVYHILKGK